MGELYKRPAYLCLHPGPEQEEEGEVLPFGFSAFFFFVWAKISLLQNLQSLVHFQRRLAAFVISLTSPEVVRIVMCVKMCLTHFLYQVCDGRVSNSSFSWLWRCTRAVRNCHSLPTSNIRGPLIVLLNYSLCCLLPQGSLRKSVAFWCLNICPVIWKSNSGVVAFFPPSIFSNDGWTELSFSHPLNQSFPPCKGKKTIWNVVIWLMKCGVGKR